MNIVMTLTVSVLFLLSLGGVVFAFAGAGSDKSRKRLAAVAKPSIAARVAKGGSDANQQRRKNVQTMLKELEKQQAEKKTRPSLRRRIEQAGLTITVKTYWIASGVAGLIAGIAAFV